jgi:putative NADH-flavin reductase
VNIIVFGARGRMGRRVAAEALRRGHKVTGAVRGGSLEPADGVTVANADATDARAVAEAARGHDAAVNAIGRSADDPAGLVAAVDALLTGLAEAEVPRLVVVGGSGSLLTDEGERFIDSPAFNPRARPFAMAQVDALAAYRAAETAVSWSYVSPPALLEPGERTGRYRLGGDTLLRAADGSSAISMEDLACAILDELESPRHDRERFTVAGEAGA